MLESSDLRIFQMVAREGSVSKAAQKLQYVQSNVSARIKHLESSLGTSLFYRHKKGVTLTATGKILLTYSNRILYLLKEAEAALTAPDSPRGSLSIGAKDSTAAVRLPSILARYRKRFPEVDLSLMTGTTEEIVSSLLEYQLDCGIVAGPVHHPDLVQEVIAQEEIVLVSDLETPPVRRLRNLKRPLFLVNRKGCAHRFLLEQWLRDEGIPAKFMEFGGVETILKSVRAGLGYTLTSRTVVQESEMDQAVKCHPVPEKYSSLPTVLIRRQDVQLNSTLKSFLEIIQEDYGKQT
ncbi:LysR family transcriptional regulator [Effusibacillus lacus]|uniref:LysR family transcriptional regulator n=1 Tax=Effusibacillus lacus TaxID=1348429 RepID=A0A292YQ77_9BACL|nr:LysR family transcriptional regulator [Effusibacillus lacus]TCS70644.1 DNA-binding transcriptional LysR family regulator [Effusibacillus lacus]GAX90640.1 LysR family transcriptional regulator [Effusibacillus lacus]